MLTIKFSHDYPKLPPQPFGTIAVLRNVDLVHRKDMIESFVEYDTVQITERLSRTVSFTTCRSWRPWAHRHYLDSVGQAFLLSKTEPKDG